MLDSSFLAHWDKDQAGLITSYHEYNSLANGNDDNNDRWEGFKRRGKGEKLNTSDIQLRPEALMTPDEKLLIVLNNDTLSFYDVSDPLSPVRRFEC